MSIERCIRVAREAGEITQEYADELVRQFHRLLAEVGDPHRARDELVARITAEATQRRRQALLAERARQRIEAFLGSYRNPRGEADPAAAMVALIEHHGPVVMPQGTSSMMGRYHAIVGEAQARMEELMNHHRRTAVTGTVRDRARLENLVREAFGQGTGDQMAANFARIWGEVSEDLRQRFNAAGGHIGRLEGWGLPQVHNPRALLHAGMQEWISYITPRLDLARMRHPITGGPMTPGDLRDSLEYIWRNITTDGWAERAPSQVAFGRGSVSNQRADARFLQFRDADAWLEYQREFGGGSDPFRAMMGHIRGMAEDIAAMETFGPNPRGMLTYIQQYVLQQAHLARAGMPALFPARDLIGREYDAGGGVTTRDPVNYANSLVNLTDNMWDLFRGASGAAVDRRIADTFATVRNLNVAAKLGSAAISAVSDMGFQQMARLYTGLPFLGIWRDYLRAFVTENARRDAVRAGLIMDTAISSLAENARWEGSMHGPEWSRYLADRTLAWSGLSAWTQTGRHAFGLTMQGEFASRTHLGFGALPEQMQRLLQRYGLSASDWERLRLDGAGVPHDVDFLSPAALRGTLGGDRLVDRWLEMVLMESEYATPLGTLRARASVYGGTQTGTWIGEVSRSFWQFKMFGVSVTMLQAQRIAADMVARGAWRGAGYAAGLLITTTLFGALALQLKEIAKGKDPQPMDDPRKSLNFWGRAMLQGGGFGIYGDFLAADQARTMGGLARTLAGPTVDTASSLSSLVGGGIGRHIRGEKTNTGREAVRVLGGNTPGGSIWYLRAAYERVALDTLQRLVDPEASEAFRRKAQQQRKDYGNEFWWAPGKGALPQRAPGLSSR
ncbi:hypothetical protein JDN40_14310 [Rhodomicrobium vannielii ATCC 17100]|uniref:hypothetical protein n=1 Tax=Rhodomicrobium vannielii TaxID=1069 RepID=UPI00191A4AE1|nr:hypothetical protein [Rhodomicrobium vannielii]MBJ7535281.1 hypothetical protein [Rhodomicrobium vannielii ATCC 17100]